MIHHPSPPYPATRLTYFSKCFSKPPLLRSLMRQTRLRVMESTKASAIPREVGMAMVASMLLSSSVKNLNGNYIYICICVCVFTHFFIWIQNNVGVSSRFSHKPMGLFQKGPEMDNIWLCLLSGFPSSEEVDRIFTGSVVQSVAIG